MSDTALTIGDHTRATVSPHGAELTSLKTEAGAELLWQAGPEWPRHAPVLFPIVGRLDSDRLLHEGVAHPMTQHGFARDRTFRLLSHSEDGCRFGLEDDARSRASYPFAFELEIGYRVRGHRLVAEYRVHNPGDVALPFSIGAHPAFAWPLPGANGAAHEIRFEQAEPAPIRTVRGGLLRAETTPTPIRDRRLRLEPSLFRDDALILEAPRSRSLRYGVTEGPALDIAWTGFVQLGVWSKPGASFLCVEPWCGLASPEGFTGEFRDKPYLLSLPPGGSFEASWSVTPEPIA